MKKTLLRKCPACREIVGAESNICPRCGVAFRSALIRRVLGWAVLAGLVVWILGHRILHLF